MILESICGFSEILFYFIFPTKIHSHTLLFSKLLEDDEKKEKVVWFAEFLDVSGCLRQPDVKTLPSLKVWTL